MSRGSIVVLVIAFAVTVGVIARGARSEQEFPPEPIPHASVECYRAHGLESYCACLERLEQAHDRGAPDAASSEPPFYLSPAARFAARSPQLYPIITSDTPSCVQMPSIAPSPIGSST